ncbi:TPA: hypothetical protein EYP38_01770 [Candidatus Micrarchaeota archaeon]|nr:hypothetical protein [Candidatus Micrarchaeota archaeon]
MKKFEYSESYFSTPADKLQEIELGKHDDYDLPEFSKEVPSASSKSEKGDTVTVRYSWRNKESPSLKVRNIEYSREEPLEDFYKTNARDGADTICVKHNNAVYILRKTSREVAQALYRASSKISAAVERIVGWLRSLAGNDYAISKVEDDAWSFDPRVAREHVNHVELESLDEGHKDRLCDMIIEKIADMHANNLIIGRFTLNNLLFYGNDIRLSDLRKMRVSRRKSFVVDEFKNIIQYLFAIGLMDKGDIYSAVAAYATMNEDSCNDWYQSRKGSRPADELELTCEIEKEIYS